jgi:hypothetical protein
MLARIVGHLHRVEDAAGAAVIPNEIDLALRETRVHHNRPGIDLRGGEDQRDQREAVLADHHGPVAGTNIMELQDGRRVCDDGRQFGVGPGDIALHQGWVVRALARERFDDVADPVRKLGQDLLRFARRRRVHARLAPWCRSCNRCLQMIGVILKLSIGELHIVFGPLHSVSAR